MRYTIKRVHGWKTWRVWGEAERDWVMPPRSTQEEAEADADLLNGA